MDLGRGEREERTKTEIKVKRGGVIKGNEGERREEKMREIGREWKGREKETQRWKGERKRGGS